MKLPKQAAPVMRNAKVLKQKTNVVKSTGNSWVYPSGGFEACMDHLLGSFGLCELFFDPSEK